MRSRWFSFGRLAALVTLLAAAAGLVWHAGRSTDAAPVPATRLALLAPDGWQDSDPHVQAWRDAAAELGFPLEVVGDSQLLRDPDAWRDAALVLPDTIHRRATEQLLAHLTRRVEAGGRLMLVHDAGVMDMAGRYHPEQSRLSGLAGVRYALWGQLGTAMVRAGEAQVLAAALPALQFPPGKLMRGDNRRPLTSQQEPVRPDERLTVVGYQYGLLHYPSFSTAGSFDGQRLMVAPDEALLAGRHRVGRGEVLFVNLPLGYLKLRTDSLLMHSLLRLYAQDMVQLPQLSAMPGGRGGLVMNWHVDSGNAVPAMEQLADLGAFEQGPYSVHLTTGPDVDVPGDGKGMDLGTNRVMRDWIKRFVARGDEVGSHGGWIHNVFGRQVGTGDRHEMASMIERNSAAVAAASGLRVREYSAPAGNHPAWVTEWLREHDVRAFYFTGDSGMPPTRSFQDGHRPPAGMWAFPVLSFGQVAAFEEAHAHGVADDQIGAWLGDVSDYCANNRTLRLVYFHPPGVALYPAAFRSWLVHTGSLVREGKLRWMTMAQFAEHANRRLRLQWRLQAASGDADGGPLRVVASHPDGLSQATWLVPASRFGQPRPVSGEARVVRDGAFWVVEATSGNALEFDLPAAPSSSATASLSPVPIGS